MSRLIYLIKKEFTQIRRDPTVLRLILIAPIFQLVLFGYAASNDVRNVPVAVCDEDNSADSRQLVEEIGQSRYFHLLPMARDPRELQDLLLRGTIQIGLSIPEDFERTMARGETAEIGMFVDGTDSNNATVAASYLAGILQRRKERFEERAVRAAGLYNVGVPSVQSDPRVWYNQELKSVNFMVPGVFAMILMVLTVNLAALAVVREREVGTLEQLLVTPLRARELLVGKTVPFAVVALFDAAIIFLLARGWFHVPFRGSVVLLFAMSLVFLLHTLGLGLAISALAHTQQEAQLTAFMVTMPYVLLSGFMYPIQNMPVIIQYLTYAIPLRYFLEIVRGIFLRGVGVAVLWPQMLVLVGFGVVTFGVGALAFKKRL
jgi:ABC-2 type transport system permease protein